MAKTGYSCVDDPGGTGLLRKARVENVEKFSKIFIKEGTKCLVVRNGNDLGELEPGMWEIDSEIWPFLKGIQNIVSKGKDHYRNEFFYYDTDPSVYRNLSFTVDNLLCKDRKSNLLVQCNPIVNVAVRVNDASKLYNCLKGFGLDNNAISDFLDKRITPKVKSDLFEKSNNEAIIDFNANAMSFKDDLEDDITRQLEDLGLTTVEAQVMDLGIVQKDIDKLSGFYDKLADIETIKEYAKLFNGDMEKAIEYHLIKSGIDKDSKIAFMQLLKLL